ncbi:MAG TPA: hypothetical protein VHP33_07055 [Polyangiaceae bacterium]|nr:hypothetical protein [Polyangiaceae bacterium]
MRAAGAFGLAFVLSLGGCGNEIVLGDSLSALPTPSGGAGATSGSSGGATSVSGTAGTSSGGSGTAGGGVAGSGSAPSDPQLPAPGSLLWSTDHEVGDFSDWERGGEALGGEYEWGEVNAYVDIGIGLEGSNGIVADINTKSRGETSAGVRLYRRIHDGPAYYSAWFRLEEAHTVTDWWSIFLFHARDDSLSLDNDVSLWDVRVVDTPGGEMSLQFFDHDTMTGTLASRAGRVAPGEWFELRAYLDYRPPNATRLAVWVGETLLFDMKDLHTDVQNNVYWCIGNGAAELDPIDSMLYMDDAAMRKPAP